MIFLSVETIKDPVARQNFLLIQEQFRTDTLLRGNFKFFETTFPVAISNFKIRHGLGFVPLDIIQTSRIGAGTVTWNYTLFDINYLDVTVSAAVKIRFFVGAYIEGSGA